MVWSNSEDENPSHGEVTSLTKLEALEVSSNPFSSNNNLDIHKLQKEYEELIKLDENNLRNIEEH